MKANLRILTVATVLCAGRFAAGASAADQAEKRERHTGPNGGRNLDGYPHPEFHIQEDRGVVVRFYVHETKETKLAPIGE